MRSLAFAAACLFGLAAAQIPDFSDMNVVDAYCAARQDGSDAMIPQNANVDENDCKKLPLWDFTIANLSDNLTWTQSQIESDTGYIRTLVRITGDDSGTPSSDDKGPVLLLHGAYVDGKAWFSTNHSAEEPSLPDRFFDAGYEVWINNNRGTVDSLGHTDTLTEEEYWAWDESDMVKEDLTATIKYILETREADGLDCKKLTLVTMSRGAAESTILLSEYPDATSDYIAQVVNTAACWILGINELTELLGPEFIPREDTCAEDEDDDGARMLPGNGNGNAWGNQGNGNGNNGNGNGNGNAWGNQGNGNAWGQGNGNGWGNNGISYQACKQNTYSRSDEWEKLAEVKGMLSYWQWHDFRLNYGAWKRSFGRDWKYFENWRDGITEALCAINNEFQDCQPDLQRRFQKAIDYLNDNGIYSLYGYSDLWADFVENKVCGDDLGTGVATQQLCDTLTIFTSFGFQAQGLQSFFTTGAQNVFVDTFTSYNPDFNENGWFVDPEDFKVDLSPITDVPVKNLYLDNDPTCPAPRNREIGDEIPSQSVRLTIFDDDLTHAALHSLNTNTYWAALSGLLGNAGADIDGGCPGTVTF